jgi:CDP-diacylglycerol--serine O-phosphatidyltransferase
MKAPPLQRGVIILPGALTLANLFFGVWAIVSAAEGDFTRAAWLIVFAGVADMLDGRVARVTKTGSKFGEQLDSLVDVISFGIAPALIMYHLFLSEVTGGWSWVAAFFYVSATAIRLARFNVEQAGHAKLAWHGLPSPSSGMTLATFHPFSQTPFFAQYLSDWAWPEIMTALMVVLGLLMMSHVLYPVVPKFGFRNLRGILTGLFLLAMIAASILVPSILFFPALMAYVAYGVVKALVLGFFERLPDRDPMLDEEEGDEAGAELREIHYDDAVPAGVTPRPRRGLRRRGRKPRGGRRTARKRATSPDGGESDSDTSGRHDSALNETRGKP